MTTANRRYGIAAVMVVLAVALGAVFGLVAVRAVAGYDITPFDAGTRTTVTVADRPVAIWASPESAAGTCAATDIDTGRQSDLGSPSGSVTLTTGSRTWSRIAVVQGEPGSTHLVECSASDERLVYGYAENPRISRYVLLGVAMVGAAALLVLGAFVLALVTALRSRTPRA